MQEAQIGRAIYRSLVRQLRSVRQRDPALMLLQPSFNPDVEYGQGRFLRRTEHADALASVGANPNNGLGGVLEAIKKLPNAAEVLADFQACYDRADRPKIAMVDSDKGITNLHVPSDVIIDASMPAMIRDGGKMWNADGKLEDVKCIIPDRSYSGVFAACIDDCKKNGKFDVATMGSVANVGLMAKKAEEYGSHDKTFQMDRDGEVTVFREGSSDPLFTSAVKAGDIVRMCQTKDEAVRDWVKLAVTRARLTNTPAVFWLNPERAHDAALVEKVNAYLGDHDVSGLNISIKTPVEAIDFSMARARAGARGTGSRLARSQTKGTAPRVRGGRVRRAPVATCADMARSHPMRSASSVNKRSTRRKQLCAADDPHAVRRGARAKEAAPRARALISARPKLRNGGPLSWKN